MIRPGEGLPSPALMQLLQAVLADSAEASIVMDAGGVVVHWNAAAERLLGYTAEEAVGRRIDFTHPPDRSQEFDLLLGKLRDGTPMIDVESVRVHRDGHRVEIALTASPVLGDHGELVGIGSVMRDAAARRREQRRFSTLASGFRRMASAAELRAVAEVALEVTCDLVGADRGSISLVEGDRLRMIGGRGFNAAELEPFGDVPLDADLPICRVVTGGQAEFVPADELGERYPVLEAIRDERLAGSARRSGGFVVLPLPGPDGPLGAMALTFEHGRPLDDTEQTLAVILAAQCGQALERARLFEQARSQQRRFEALVEASPLGVISLAPDGTVRQWNPACERIFGWDAGQVIGGELPFVPREARAESQRLIAEGFAGRPVLGHEIERRHRDGHPLWLRLWKVPLRDPDGAVREVVSVIEDVTADRDHAEAARRLASIVEASGDAILTIDLRSGLIEQWNPAAERMFGHSREDIVGAPLSTLVPPGREADSRMLQRSAARGETVTAHETQRLHASGRMMDVAITVFPLRDADGTVVRGSASFRDITERKRLERAQRGLQRISDAALSHLELEGLLAELLSRVQEVLEVDRAVVLMVDAPSGALRERASSDGLLEPTLDIPLGRGFSGRIAATKRPWAEEDASAVEVLSPTLSRGAASLAGVPLIAGGEVIGVLGVVSSTRRRFETQELVLMQLAGERAVLGILHAQQFEQEQAMAQTLQATLIPARLPEVDGYRIAAAYRPAAGGEVSGDFYDVVPGDDGALWAFIGDVCGKGVTAASLTAMARHTIRVLVGQGRTPAEVLTELNGAILKLDTPVPFLTAALARLEHGPDGVTAHVSLGGHPPALLLRRGGGLERLGHAGTLLGHSDDVTLADATETMHVGDLLVLHTDGATDVRRHGEVFGEERLAEILAGCAGLSPQQVVEQIDRAVSEFQGKTDDDVALLCIEIERPEV